MNSEQNLNCVVVKEKCTENVLYCLHHSTTIQHIVELLQPKQGEHVILEDEDHNTLRVSDIQSPRVIYACKFVPSKEQKKRRSAIIELMPTQPSSGQKPKSRHNSILI